MPGYAARPDSMDFRDRMYVPPLVEVPAQMPLEEYMKHKVPVLDQVDEGACIGYAMATMIHYQLCTRREPDRKQVSVGMIYEMARRYDEWPGRNYLGSSARGAMKGWYKHGICAEELWGYDPKNPDRLLTDERAADAARRPLGVYYRVPPKDLSAMHAALAECGVLFAASIVHGGWKKMGENLDKKEALIRRESRSVGGHAFALVGYDSEGFWVQNSWGEKWGYKGFAKLLYDDWLAHGQDVWVGRLGVPVKMSGSVSAVEKAATGK
ncbi:MAG: C1 family peptidase [Deltaproteobacteria bacterium]|nr:C1 family peptidase [Deltaproteobacteria bacterium]